MDHLAIPVSDQERSRRFYEAYFGCGARPARRYRDGVLMLYNAPKTSKIQISAQRSGRSSSPTIHTAAIERGLRSIRARTSSSPYSGSLPHHGP
jgi:catechol 2,3-dioxygenase-like lactoylglutathione lyase family enzyme